MAKIFDIDFRKGTLIDSVSGQQGAFTKGDGGFVRTEKGTALKFDGGSTKITIPNNDKYNFTSDFSIVAAINTTSKKAYSGIVTKYNPNGWDFILSSGIPRMAIRGSSSIDSWTSGSLINDGYWHLVIIVCTNSNISIYVDNKYSHGNSGTWIALTNTNSLLIGKRSDAGREYDGLLIKSSLYNHALSQTEIEAEYKDFLNSPLSKPTVPSIREFNYPKSLDSSHLVDSGLLAHYSFDPKTINNGVLTDVSGNGNDGTINGANIVKDGLFFRGNNYDDSIAIGYGVKTGSWTTSFRFKDYKRGNNDFILGGSDKGLIGLNHNNRVSFRDSAKVYHDSSITSESIEFIEITLVISSNGLDISFNLNGVDMGYISPTGADLYFYQLIRGYTSNAYNPNLTLIDFQFHNYAWTTQEALAYHNSFRKPLLLEDFSKYPVTTKPEHWEVVSGNVEIAEEVEVLSNDAIAELGDDIPRALIKSLGNPIINGDEVTFVDSANVEGAKQNSYWEIGKTYLIKGFVSEFNGTGSIIPPYDGSNASSEIYNNGSFEYQYMPLAYPHMFIYKRAGNTSKITITSIQEVTTVSDKLTELGIPQPTLYSRFAKWISDGAMAIQSSQAYGEWNFNVYRYSSDNLLRTAFISLDNEISTNEYRIVLLNISNSIRFQVVNSGLVSNKFITANSYINNNVWYKLKIQRLQSEGVFPMMNNTLSLNSTNLNFNNWIIGANIEVISPTSFKNIGPGIGGMYKNYSQLLPETDYMCYIKGRVLGDAFLYFNNMAGEPNISGEFDLAIPVTKKSNSYIYWVINGGGILELDHYILKRRYPADTFAVFIKAEDEKDFTLIPATSGSNPVTDGTYRESKYISIDADAGDRIKSIEVYNQVK